MRNILIAILIVLVILYVISNIRKDELSEGMTAAILDRKMITEPVVPKSDYDKIELAMRSTESIAAENLAVAAGLSGVGKQYGACGSENPGADDDFNEIPPAMIYDLEPDYLTSRERMGACGKLSKSQRRPDFRSDVSLLGTRNDDIYDGDRAVVAGRSGRCNTGPRTALAAIYGPAASQGMHTVLGDQPDPAACELLGEQGYMYKTACMTKM